jgi:hypothetical protein
VKHFYELAFHFDHGQQKFSKLKFSEGKIIVLLSFKNINNGNIKQARRHCRLHPWSLFSKDPINEEEDKTKRT